MNPDILPKINALDWDRKHTGHYKTQGEGIGEYNEKEIIFFISICHTCQTCYLYDWVFKMEGINA